MGAGDSLVSVVIPSFNRERYLEFCLQSVMRQTHPRWEAIVVDDGSTDGTRPLMERLQSQDSRIRYVAQENAGVSAARNHGLRVAAGEFIALLDSDDAWTPWKLELQLNAFRALPDVGMIWTDMCAIDDEGALLHDRFLRRMYGAYRRLGETPLFETSIDVLQPESMGGGAASVGYGDLYSKMIYGNLVHTSTVLMRRERLQQVQGFDEGFRRAGEDYDFHLRTCRNGTVGFIDLPSTLYRIGCDDQITHRRNQVHFARAFVQTLQREMREHRGRIQLTRSTLRSILSDAHSWLGTELDDAGRTLEGIAQLTQALLQAPTNRYAWRQLVRAIVPPPLRSGLKRLVKGAAPTPDAVST